jgi:hypothetical protein
MSNPPLIGLVDEHAPVQASYVGCRVNGFLAKKREQNQSDFSHWVVHPGQLLFVSLDDNNQGAVPEVVANLRGNTSKLWPFGVAHDSVLDGKLAHDNPHSVAGISAIVSGCVTMQIPAPHATLQVGATLFVSLGAGGNKGVPNVSGQIYKDMPDYRGPITFQSPSGCAGDQYATCRIGTIVEVHPSSYGVVRVCLDIEGFSSKNQNKIAKDDQTPHPTIAPQHPVYIACNAGINNGGWREGYPVKLDVPNAKKSTTDFLEGECLKENKSNADPVMLDDLPKCVGIAADTLAAHPNEKNGVKAPASLAVDGVVSMIGDFRAKVGASIRLMPANITARVVSYLGGGEHYVVLNSQGNRYTGSPAGDIPGFKAAPQPLDLAAKFDSNNKPSTAASTVDTEVTETYATFEAESTSAAFAADPPAPKPKTASMPKTKKVRRN